MTKKDLFKIVAVLVAVLYLIIISFVYGFSGKIVALNALYCLLSLFIIFYSNELGNFVGMSGLIYVDTPSPGIIIYVLGWILLLLPIIRLVLIS